MFHGITIRLYHGVDRDRLTAALQELRAAGADAVSIIAHNYCIIRSDPGNPNHDVLPAPAPLSQHDAQYFFADRDDGGAGGLGLVGNTTPPDDVRWVCQQARDLGFSVLLKPHVDPLRW